MKARYLASVIGCAAVLATAPAWAEFKWQFSFSDTTNCLGSNGTPACNFGNTRNASSVTKLSGPDPAPAKTSITAQAWSNTKGGTISSPSAGPLETAYLPAWGSYGLGVQNRDMKNFPGSVPPGAGDRGDGVEGGPPEHAMDNNERSDSILFSFAGDKVQLTGVEIGWSQTDSDIFVLAYTGSGALKLGDLNYGDLTSNGWTLVGNYPDIGTNTKVAVNTGTYTGGTPVSANYWLIGTYNSAFGATGCYVGTKNKCNEGNDYVKLLAVYGTPTHDNKVPEPSSALLIGFAIVGLWRFRAARGG